MSSLSEFFMILLTGCCQKTDFDIRIYFFNWLHNSKPFIFGIITSSMTRAYIFGLKLLRASTGSLNVSTVNPACSKAIFSISVISGSSSTYKSFFFLLLDNRDVTDQTISWPYSLSWFYNNRLCHLLLLLFQLWV